MQKRKYAGRRPGRSEKKLFKKLILLSLVAAVLAGGTFAGYTFTQKKSRNTNTVTALYNFWAEGDVQKTYDIADSILDKTPLQNTARTFRGYSAFKLAVSEPDDTVQTQAYLDRAINDLRVALQTARPQSVGQTAYVLGLTYFYKDKSASSYYYADLAIKYLEQAMQNGYQSEDIPELLGLSYADLGETEKSIESFTEALRTRESDILLYNIAKQYYKNSAGAVAKQYLKRALDLSKDDDILINSHNVLGQIYIDEENFNDAKEEFEAILKKNSNSADAHYGLGVLYEHQGDMAKARSEWRTCLKLQVNHPGALQKMSEIK